MKAWALRRDLALVVGLSCGGCGASAADHEPFAGAPILRFAPSTGTNAELLTTFSVKRWVSATGLPIEIAADGMRVERPLRVFDLEGNELCGRVDREANAILVALAPAVDCPSANVVTLHEMGHALRGEGSHAASGIMVSGDSWTTSDDGINDDSLSLVCELAPCRVMVPEPD